MRVKVCKTGTVIHLVRDEVTRVLIEAGIIEEVREPVPPPPPPPHQLTWTVGETLLSGEPVVEASCDICHFKLPVFNPDKKFAVEHLGKTEIIPADVLELYRERRGKKK